MLVAHDTRGRERSCIQTQSSALPGDAATIRAKDSRSLNQNSRFPNSIYRLNVSLSLTRSRATRALCSERNCKQRTSNSGSLSITSAGEIGTQRELSSPCSCSVTWSETSTKKKKKEERKTYDLLDTRPECDTVQCHELHCSSPRLRPCPPNYP